MSDHHVNTPLDADAERLASLGYKSEFRRDMSLWANFALGFTYLSPVVGIYTLFATSLALGGPPMIWALLIAGVGQMLVALVFGEIVSQYPLAGGVYPWARRLWGRKWAWMTGWVYVMALFSTIAGVAYGAAPYTAAIVGFEPTTGATVLCALAVLALATAINLMGTRVLAQAAIIGFVAEILGALVVGGYLLIFERHHDLSVLFDSFGAEGDGSYLSAFLAASLIGVFQYYGFEACGDVAEEVPNPGRRIPKSMRRTIYIGGAAATFVCLALTLSVVDFHAVIKGEGGDPVTGVLTSAFGPVGAWAVIGVVLISFLSCAMSLQAAASRLVYAYARDKMVFGSGLLSRFSQERHVPPYALLLSAILPGIIVVGSMVSTDALLKIISFSSVGIYIAFQMVVLAALRARLKGWKPSGEYQLGRYGMPVTVGALVYGVAAVVNICWPRTPDAAWYDNWIVLLSAAAVMVIGFLYMGISRPHSRSDAPHGDAIPGGGFQRAAVNAV
ncbi:APC family permease [Metapseudomonas resinovorans]|uniref:Putative polyamine transporter n=1 Tax=Metapseudomonas resinovorans NBRC 106553 TaxID=1245471 RepID=S6ANT4_METRE|nr:amino acid permease [Pseudomonas resinovorans]BAN50695.1 putative polyamine transporter [Pseudomonas resinovorans NBRC 106553]